eukprot:13187524-Ditylum_brightwellii.AAC.1
MIICLTFMTAHSIPDGKQHYSSTKPDQLKLWPCWPPHILALHHGSSSRFCCSHCEATTNSRFSYH